MKTRKRGAMGRLRFSAFARRLAVWTGRPSAFMVNTSTTIVTFLMVFLIQNTQNRDTEAIQIKLDELIRATQGAHNALLNLEHLEDEELERYRSHYAALARSALAKLRAGELDTDSPEIKVYAKK
jgi:low affinity Fe/Cu permease